MDLDDREIVATVQAEVRAEVAVEMPAPGNGEAAVERAVAAFPDGSGRPVETRAGCLDRLADLYEAHLTELMAVAVQEAQKTIPAALAEVREAVGFCRYYAARARTDQSGTASSGGRVCQYV